MDFMLKFTDYPFLCIVGVLINLLAYIYIIYSDFLNTLYVFNPF